MGRCQRPYASSSGYSSTSITAMLQELVAEIEAHLKVEFQQQLDYLARELRLPPMFWDGFRAGIVGPTDQCEGQCKSNCSYLAYMVRPDVGCRLWFGTLIDVQKVPSGSSSSVFIRLSTSDLVADPKKKKDSKKVIIILIVVSLFIISICICFSWKLIVKCRGKKNIVEASPVDSSIQDALSQVDLQDLPLLRFEILVNATDNFCEANQLGKGGFGPVYKGKLSDGTEIAVKRLSQASKQGMQEFMNEVA
ncbi:hypothetical protein ACS0TY_004314 [Phlomoides rotata]